jgi:hypothetical protein
VKFSPGGKGLWNGKRFTYSALPGDGCGILRLSGTAALPGAVSFARDGGGIVRLYKAVKNAGGVSGYSCTDKLLHTLSPAAKQGK